MEITEQITNASSENFQELGYGFLEKVYQRAMRMELGPGGFHTEIESDIQFQYKTKLLVITGQTFC
ncbi:MAG: nuclease superfamily [Planctomycetota bacterium]|jgi:GxxExxY protein